MRDITTVFALIVIIVVAVTTGCSYNRMHFQRSPRS